jgi:alanine dehydrogenase
MTGLTLGVMATTRKENEWRLPIHPAHLDWIHPDLRQHIFLEEGYGTRFGSTEEELEPLVGGILTKQQLLDSCDVILLPKPSAQDLKEMRPGQVLWGWPHCVQNEGLTQVAIERRLTVIAWESMNRWMGDGAFKVHIFNENNQLAGYCSVLQAMQIMGLTGQYGRRLKAAVISYGATGKGAVSGLRALGVPDISVLTQRDVSAVPAPVEWVERLRFERRDDGSPEVEVVMDEGNVPVAEFLAERDIIVNCVLQDPDEPLMFVTSEDLSLFNKGSLLIDVSCDEGMGFEWAIPTTFEEPMLIVGDDVHYYAVDHSPSYLWNSTTWTISEALLPYLGSVMSGRSGWDADPTIKRAIEIRDGVVENPKILSFQGRSATYPHAKS